MSRSVIAPKKSSPCCIGCVVMLVIVIGLSAALGIYMYRFARENLTLVNVSTKADPPLDTPAEELLPATAGSFKRTALYNTLDSVPQWKDLATSGAHLAVYTEPAGIQMTVIAASTEATRKQREVGTGLLTLGRTKANSADTGVTIKDPFTTSTAQTITTWSKPNWTFMVQTTSTLMPQFLENFYPGGNEETTAPVTAEPVMTPQAAPAETPAALNETPEPATPENAAPAPVAETPAPPVSEQAPVEAPAPAPEASEVPAPPASEESTATL